MEATTQATPLRMPAAFIGHGSPMNTLERNRFTEAWRDLGRRLPRPRAILCISAHWFIKATAVTAMERPRVIHDFYGFPRELFEFDYPAPGAPDVAREIEGLLGTKHVVLDQESWGLDHGTWSVLAHVAPDADIPVVQLSLHAEEPPERHVEIGRALAPLRERGVFIVGSGNVVHNLRRMDRRHPEGAFDWAERFDAEVQRVMAIDPAALVDAPRHPDYAMSAPTPEHFMPLYYFAGLCAQAGETSHPFVTGGAMGSLTMTSFTTGLDWRAPLVDGSGEGVTLPASTPADQTNL
ncbi:4,5-DOPA dioxygenase extradiol [Ramlibacter algicola]|uniref:4,5-DOPA dioxygenase extradiol n=1 Tax=Ramlibacter algicola TaxID=2795217 RepID=A0A934Q2V8_9BURK|nr:4,5-DOPA dioxygenase extradiol [Ramlibacter algicola]MBK0393961.1 4,5-DOPA dioxygenase extradiol [Ramlibacter algicola]